VVISYFSNWVHANWLILNVDKMIIVKFTQSDQPRGLVVRVSDY